MAARGWGLDQDRNTESEAERGNGCQSLEGGRDTQLGLEIYIHRDRHTGRDTETKQWGQTHRDRGREAGKDKTEREREGTEAKTGMERERDG